MTIERMMADSQEAPRMGHDPKTAESLGKVETVTTTEQGVSASVNPAGDVLQDMADKLASGKLAEGMPVVATGGVVEGDMVIGLSGAELDEYTIRGGDVNRDLAGDEISVPGFDDDEPTGEEVSGAVAALSERSPEYARVVETIQQRETDPPEYALSSFGLDASDMTRDPENRASGAFSAQAAPRRPYVHPDTIRPANPSDRDMRPIYNIQAFSGQWLGWNGPGTGNRWGQHGRWANPDHEQAVEWLISELNAGYERGCRLIHIRPIAGHMRGETHMAHSTWLVESMPLERRRILARRLMEWMVTHQDATIELHINAHIASATTLRMNTHPDFRVPNLVKKADADLMMQTIHPWLELARVVGGRVGFSVDAASGHDRADVWTSIGNALKLAGVPIRGEAIPVHDGQLLGEHVECLEWWALDFDKSRVVRNLERVMGLNPRTWICTARQRLTVGLGSGLGLNGAEDNQVSLVEHYMRRGWRVHAWHPDVLTEAWRVYHQLEAEIGAHTEPAEPGPRRERGPAKGGQL